MHLQHHLLNAAHKQPSILNVVNQGDTSALDPFPYPFSCRTANVVTVNSSLAITQGIQFSAPFTSEYSLAQHKRYYDGYDCDGM